MSASRIRVDKPLLLVDVASFDCYELLYPCFLLLAEVADVCL